MALAPSNDMATHRKGCHAMTDEPAPAALPLRATVAWAARCAERVRLLLDRFLGGFDDEYAQAVRTAIGVAEAFARGEVIDRNQGWAACATAEAVAEMAEFPPCRLAALAAANAAAAAYAASEELA